MRYFILCLLGLSALPGYARNYTNFDVAIYIPVGVVKSFKAPHKLEGDWARISGPLKVDKVCIEVQRDRNLASDNLLERRGRAMPGNWRRSSDVQISRGDH